MADHTAPRPSTHPSRRRPHEPLHRGVRFTRVIAAFNRALTDHFPLVPYQDSLGRNRVAGRARRARALAVIHALAALQSRARSGVVYAGYVALGHAVHRSRSTAYRAAVDLRRAQLVDWTQGGGKTHDEVGKVVDAANGYRVHEAVAGPAVRKARQSGKHQVLGDRGRDLAEAGSEWVRGLKRHARRGPPAA